MGRLRGDSVYEEPVKKGGGKDAPIVNLIREGVSFGVFCDLDVLF